jgi:hypothetical protein
MLGLNNKIISLGLCLVMSGCASTCFDYAKVGVGYKLYETKMVFDGKEFNDPITARLELGTQCDAYSFGYSHHSHYMTGFPFNNKSEYTRDEVFVDYMYKF